MTVPDWHQACDIGFLQSPHKTSGLWQLWDAKDGGAWPSAQTGGRVGGWGTSVWDEVGHLEAPPEGQGQTSSSALKAVKGVLQYPLSHAGSPPG